MTDLPGARETSLATTLAPERAIGKVRKFVNRRRRSDTFKDAFYARDRLGTSVPAVDTAEADASVIDVVTAVDALIDSLDASTPPTLNAPKRTSTPQHYSSIFVGPSLRKDKTTGATRVVRHRTPSPWHEITEGELLDWLYAGANALGTLCDFSLNLNPDVASKALAQPSALDWLRRRVAHHLKREFVRTLPFVVVIEETQDGRPHLHGLLTLPTDKRTLARARRALRRAGGGGMQKMAQVRPGPDAGWAAYIGKDARLARPGLRALRDQSRVLRSLNYQGKAISYSQDVGREARRLYEDWRASIAPSRREISTAPKEWKKKSKSLLTYTCSYLREHLLTTTANGLIEDASTPGEQQQCIRLNDTYLTRPMTPSWLASPAARGSIYAPRSWALASILRPTLWTPAPPRRSSRARSRVASTATRSWSRSGSSGTCGPRRSCPTSCASTLIICAGRKGRRLRDSAEGAGGRLGPSGSRSAPPAVGRR